MSSCQIPQDTFRGPVESLVLGSLQVVANLCMCKTKINTFYATTYLEKQIHFLVSLRTTKMFFQSFSSCQRDASSCSIYYQAAVGAFTFWSILFRIFLFAEGCFLTEGNSQLLVFPVLLTRRFDKHTYEGAGYCSMCLNCTQLEKG